MPWYVLVLLATAFVLMFWHAFKIRPLPKNRPFIAALTKRIIDDVLLKYPYSHTKLVMFIFYGFVSLWLISLGVLWIIISPSLLSILYTSVLIILLLYNAYAIRRNIIEYPPKSSSQEPQVEETKPEAK